MANTLNVVSATDQTTKYGYSSFHIDPENKFPGSKYYYKIEDVDIPEYASRISLDGWTVFSGDLDIWLESGITLTFVECINTLLKAKGKCVSVSHRLDKYFEIVSATETETTDTLFIEVNAREFDYGYEDIDTIENPIIINDFYVGDDDEIQYDFVFINFGSEEEDVVDENPEVEDLGDEEVDIIEDDFDEEEYSGIDEDGPIYITGPEYDYNEYIDGGSQSPPFNLLKYVYKVDLFKAGPNNIANHEKEFGTPFTEEGYQEWDLESNIVVKKTKGYQKAYTIWFYCLDEDDRILDFSYVIGDLSETSGHILPLLIKARSNVKTPGYTIIDLVTKLDNLDPDPIEWDMPDEFDYGDDEDDEIVIERQSDDFGYYTVDTFNFENGAQYYDFLYENMPVVKGSKLYYHIGRKINGYYNDPTIVFKRMLDMKVGPVDNDTVITVVEFNGDHTLKYGTVKAKVADGSGDDIYFPIDTARAIRTDYTVIDIDNEIEEENTYIYKFLNDIREMPEYLQIITVDDGYTALGTEKHYEIHCETDGALLCVCEVDTSKKVYRIGTVNVKIGIGSLGSIDAYICETNSSNGKIKIDISDKNTEHDCTYWYNTKDVKPTRYHERLSPNDWIQFECDMSELPIEPNTQIVVCECNDVGNAEKYATIITPYRYDIPPIVVDVSGTIRSTNTVMLSMSYSNLSTYFYKIGGDIRAFFQSIDESWVSLPSNLTIVAEPSSKITVVKVDEYKRVIQMGYTVTPDEYKDIGNVVVQTISTSAEANRIVISIPQATIHTQYYYNTSGILPQYYNEFIEPSQWTRLPLGQFASGDNITDCALTINPGTTLYIAQTDALYHASAKGTFVTPSVYDSMEQLSITIFATLQRTNSIYVTVNNAKAGYTYKYKNGDQLIAYLDTIDGSWAAIGSDGAIVTNVNTLNTIIEVNSVNQITACAKITSPATYTDDSGSGGGETEPGSEVPAVVKYSMKSYTALIEVPSRDVTLGSTKYLCGSLHGITFNSDKTNVYISKSYSVDASKRTKPFPATFDKISNIKSSPSITKHDIKNSSGKVEGVCRHGNDLCWAKHAGSNKFFHATMNDTSDDSFTLVVTNTSGVIQNKIMVHKNGKNKSMSGITYYKTDTNGDILLILNDGSIDYEDGSRRRKYGIYRYNGSSCEYTGETWTCYTKIAEKYTAQGIYWHPDQQLLYIIFFDSSKSEVRYNVIWAFDPTKRSVDGMMYCVRKLTLTGPSGSAFEIESIDMDGNTIYAAVNRTNSKIDAVFKITLQKS